MMSIRLSTLIDHRSRAGIAGQLSVGVESIQVLGFAQKTSGGSRPNAFLLKEPFPNWLVNPWLISYPQARNFHSFEPTLIWNDLRQGVET